ncbi:mitochondrial F1F0 ATP synthase subunit Atp18, putative [Talaromyces marneffei ATCC 18224]|uniref:Mitochondrial F1F0 ATP synthase subunit Atp18, putative n=1 Tax=Talaromyces marneffei (strain ATCC 18224 / CBS 334.59 / QM 7333) TaxID=441960 RepID=B6QQS6_TALMQ|nr:mitochondrial F1F0 ATP synthase subunit Atp18, putative [Talaromyces marneffei ATCC 18224]EEA20702.1 mitochondrial F1F0 ATP synthase subunit Atp18, putative [Talaromyces marneffei ATCC 18224]
MNTDRWFQGLIVLYGVNAAANASMASNEWKDDPRNPNAKPKGKQ